jgi:membrane protein DedA with SNARE-associated domain
MAEALELIAAHGALILFVVIRADQAGPPVPMEPFLLGADALMAVGKLAVLPTALSLVVAGFLGNLAWYLPGFACRAALEPDSCVRRTENLFTRLGVKSLLVSKFAPGLDVLGPPLAGAFGTPFARFALFDLAGLAIRLGACVGFGAVALYLLAKHARRVRVARRLLDGDAKPVVVDLRHRLAARERPVLIPGAPAFSPDDVAARHGEIPRDRDVVLYCA